VQTEGSQFRKTSGSRLRCGATHLFMFSHQSGSLSCYVGDVVSIENDMGHFRFTER
jgi:hypothetical protein